jgi:hypothetical protein
MIRLWSNIGKLISKLAISLTDDRSTNLHAEEEVDSQMIEETQDANTPQGKNPPVSSGSGSLAVTTEWYSSS